MPAIFPKPDKSSPLTEADGKTALQAWFDFWGYLESQIKAVAAQIAALVILAPATQAEQEAAVSNTVAVTPGRQKFHPAHPKAWAYFTQSAGTYTLAASFGVSGFSKAATGRIDITLSTAFSSTSFAGIASANEAGPFTAAEVLPNRTAANYRINLRNANTNTDTDVGFSIMFFGDQ